MAKSTIPTYKDLGISTMTNETTASQQKSIGDDAPKGWEPVYLAWNDQINAWVDVGVAEYLAADTQDRRMAYEPQGAAA